MLSKSHDSSDGVDDVDDVDDVDEAAHKSGAKTGPNQD